MYVYIYIDLRTGLYNCLYMYMYIYMYMYMCMSVWFCASVRVCRPYMLAGFRNDLLDHVLEPLAPQLPGLPVTS